MKVFKEFKEFAAKGNMIDLDYRYNHWCGFLRVVNLLVNDIIMPTIGLLLGRVDFSNLFLITLTG